MQGRGKDAGETDGGGEGGAGGNRGGGHANRHSWDPETAQRYQSGGEKIERSQSARFDRVATATDTNNRFERLNPDAETPGDQSKPSPASGVVVGGGGGGGKGRKRNSRSASGGSSYRSRSPKRRSGKEGGKGGGGGGGGEKEGGKEKESTAAVVSCELEWDSGSHGEQEPGELIINGGVSPAKETLLTKQASLESTASSVDKTSGASAQGGSGEGGEEGEEDGTLTKTGEKVGKDGAESEESTTQPRHTYTRVSDTVTRRTLSSCTHLHVHVIVYCTCPCWICVCSFA